ncbi:MAG: IS3 family transposase [Bacteroidaceae bacterium]|nr:IS3 family transposase [Bacteroidaceae bacterium]
MCRLLGVSKQAYYKHDDRLMQRLAREAFVVEFVKDVRRKDPGIGGNKLWLMYTRCFGEENRVGYNRFYDIIEQYGLKVRKRKRRVSTTDSRHDLPLYPNLVKSLIPTRPCQLIVSDITYVPLWTDPIDGEYKFCYLSLVTDYYTKEIIGYSVGDTLETKHTLKALEMALGHYEGNDLSGLIHHSDRGVQYASYAYTERLRGHGIGISMTENGNPKDNAVAERVNNTIKNELLKGMSFFTVDEVKAALRTAVDFYNNERPHLSLDGMTPCQASRTTGEIQKNWISFREIAIKKQMSLNNLS